MKKFNVGDKVLFTIHGYLYNAIIEDIRLEQLLYKIHNTDTHNKYWVSANSLSKWPKNMEVIK